MSSEGTSWTGELRAGAAKVDVTPAPDQLPERLLGIAGCSPATPRP